MTPGIYRHFKGGLYRIISVGTLESDGTDVVIYCHLGEEAVWVRPISSWIERVTWPDGQVRPRFIPNVPAGPAP